MIHSSYDIFLHDTFLLTRYVGEDFPWLGNAPKHGLWAKEVGIKTIMVILDSIAAALFQDIVSVSDAKIQIFLLILSS